MTTANTPNEVPPQGGMGQQPPAPTDTPSWYNSLYWFRGNLDRAGAVEWAAKKDAEAATFREQAAAIREQADATRAQAAAMLAFADKPQLMDPNFISAVNWHAENLGRLATAIHHLAGVMATQNPPQQLPPQVP